MKYSLFFVVLMVALGSHNAEAKKVNARYFVKASGSGDIITLTLDIQRVDLKANCTKTTRTLSAPSMNEGENPFASSQVTDIQCSGELKNLNLDANDKLYVDFGVVGVSASLDVIVIDGDHQQFLRKDEEMLTIDAREEPAGNLRGFVAITGDIIPKSQP